MLPETVETLLQHLERGDERQRRYAARDLVAFPSTDVVDALCARLVEETSGAVREAIVLALIGIGGEPVAGRVGALLRSQDARVRNAAVEILQSLGTQARGTVSELLKDPDRDVRLCAVNVLGEARYREAIAMLRDVVDTDPDVNVVAAAIEHLGEMGSRREDGACIEGARRRFDDPFLHYVAGLALQKMRAE